MNATQELRETEVNGSCGNPNIREYLSEYATDSINHPLAGEIEEHLLECRYCREVFLVMLGVRKQMAGNRNASEQGSSTERFLNLLDFREPGF